MSGMPTGQFGLFDRAYARKTDPGTSHAAAASVEPELNELEGKALDALLLAGARGMTLDELVLHTGLDKVTVSPRLKPLRIKGKVRDPIDRRPGNSGRPQSVWVAK